MERRLQVDYSGDIGLANLFVRERPASQKGDPAPWAMAQKIIDHGCFILTHANTLREERGLRDSVTAALLRRILITAEGVRSLVAAGLEEDAVVLFRTLIELQVNLWLVTADDTDTMAKRLAAFHYLKARRHFSKLFGNPDTRGRIQGDGEHFEWGRETSRRMKEFLDSESFAEVRKEVATSQHWHGLPTTEAAFETAGLIDDYVTLYDTFSPFTHGDNMEHDFAEIDDEGRLHLKALPQRDPARTISLLKGLCFKLVQVYERFLEDKDNPEYQPPLEATTSDGDSFQLPPVSVLVAELVRVFGDGSEPDGRGAEEGIDKG